MDATLIYFLKANLALVFFYAFYRLLASKDTFFGIRRMLLLLFWIVAFSYPLAENWTWVQHSTPAVVNNVIQVYSSVLPEVLVQPESVSSPTFSVWSYCKIGYWVVVILLLFRFCIQLGGIIYMAYTSKPAIIQGVPVRYLRKPAGPFSFFRWIFVHPESHSERELEEILIHEQTHARQGHSVDIILAELFTSLCWVNPFAWLLKREVRDNLEYLADSSVLRSGCDSKSYQYHLLGLSYTQNAAPIYTSFNVLSLKKRIRMMNKRPTRKIGIAKLFLFFPLLVSLLTLSNCKQADKNAEDNRPVTLNAFVTDLEGEPIIGATVIIKGSTSGTITDLDGKFGLEAPQNGTLQISFFNYEAKEIAVKDIQENMKIKLAPDKKVREDFSNDQVYTVVEKQPSFPGGVSVLMKYIANNIQYPKEAQEKGLQGRVITAFIVRKDGSIDDIKVMRGIDPLLDKEALRVVQSMPKWEPGEQRGEAVSVRYILPIQFKLQ